MEDPDIGRNGRNGRTQAHTSSQMFLQRPSVKKWDMMRPPETRADVSRLQSSARNRLQHSLRRLDAPIWLFNRSLTSVHPPHPIDPVPWCELWSESTKKPTGSTLNRCLKIRPIHLGEKTIETRSLRSDYFKLYCFSVRLRHLM